jgi:hypothetical protein
MDYTHEFVCLDCKKKFKAPHYRCELTGENHRVEEKQYYVGHDSLSVYWKKEQTVPSTEGEGKSIRLPGKMTTAVKGIITSTDPEEQLFFNSYKGLITFEKWQQLFVPLEERKKIAEVETRRLELQKNALLAEVAQLKAEQQAAAKKA